MDDACCQPGRGESAAALGTPGGPGERRAGMVDVAAGPFLMGNDREPLFAGDGEGPVREVTVAAFAIDTAAVTNAAFAAFADASGYRTDAERFGWSYVFVDQVAPGAQVLPAAVPGAPWWRAVEGASWRAPVGPGSHAEPDLPVVHVSWNDAIAFTAWEGTRLPTETEWEKAARGGLEQQRYPWGDTVTPGQAHVWEGDFPVRRTNGPAVPLPARSLEPNGFGLFHMVGNVWEWTSSSWAPDRTEKVVRGGSFLCHPSYCHRYRVAARTFSTPDSSTGHTGFRCAAG